MKLKNEVDQFDCGKSELIVVGDFNLNIFDRVDFAKVDYFCCELWLTQLVKSPTRVTPISSTCIDLLMTSHPDTINFTEVVHLILSDHSMIFI